MEEEENSFSSTLSKRARIGGQLSRLFFPTAIYWVVCVCSGVVYTCIYYSACLVFYASNFARERRGDKSAMGFYCCCCYRELRSREREYKWCCTERERESVGVSCCRCARIEAIIWFGEYLGKTSSSSSNGLACVRRGFFFSFFFAEHVIIVFGYIQDIIDVYSGFKARNSNRWNKNREKVNFVKVSLSRKRYTHISAAAAIYRGVSPSARRLLLLLSIPSVSLTRSLYIYISIYTSIY